MLPTDSNGFSPLHDGPLSDMMALMTFGAVFMLTANLLVWQSVPPFGRGYATWITRGVHATIGLLPVVVFGHSLIHYSPRQIWANMLEWLNAGIFGWLVFASVVFVLAGPILYVGTILYLTTVSRRKDNMLKLVRELFPNISQKTARERCREFYDIALQQGRITP